MLRNPSFMMGKRLMSCGLKKIVTGLVMLLCAHSTILAQEVQRTPPTWWFGGSGAANFDFFYGTTQVLNAAVTSRNAFHKGDGVGFNAALLLEYRPDPVWGGILQVGYDDRRGSFDNVVSPSNCPSSLSTMINYITIEPSLRFAPFSSGLYLFGGPIVGFNTGKDFTYTQEGNPAFQSKDTWSDMRTIAFSIQAGIGFDIPLMSSNASTQINLSPFVSFSPDFQGPRSVESWRVNVLRAGASLKFGSGDVIPPPPAVVEADVQFSIRAPKAVPLQRRVRETFPLRNYVFFDEGSTEVPTRYVAMTKEQATSFKEEQLQEFQPKSFAGRSLREMTVYYNILNILGDRMKRGPGTTISLSGASGQGPEQGKARAETIKRYLVDVFGIEGSRITTEGRDKPRLPSEVPGATKELALLRAGDRRVDIESTSPELMIQVGGGPHYMLKPVQIVAEVEDPLDSHVLFNVVGAKETLASWSLEITDERGLVQRFGPSTRDRENISGNTILGDRSQGDYKVVMLGQTKGGKFVRKEGSVHLVRREAPMKETVRFRILFDFDQSKTIASYEKFLTDIVTPLIPDSSLVIIHGYTDIVGEEEYNDNLSRARVQDAQTIVERALSKGGKRGITFETFGFGENLQYASFDNYFPEGRFYNRSVIIDIVPEK